MKANLYHIFFEFHGSKWIGTIAVSNEFEVFLKFCKSLKSHPHGKNAMTDTSVVRNLVTNNGACSSIHDESGVGFDATDFDVSYIGSENIPFFVRVAVNKRLNADSSGLASSWQSAGVRC